MFRHNLVNVMQPQSQAMQRVQQAVQNITMMKMQSDLPPPIVPQVMPQIIPQIIPQVMPQMQPQIPPAPKQGIPPPITPIILDSSTAVKLSMGTAMYQERALMARNDIWHRILILRGASFDKEEILKSILKTIYPADLIPVKYQLIGEDSCFLARNCDRALDQLCRRSLIVHYTDGTPIILSITLGYASIHDLKINIQPLLLTLLKKKYVPTKKSLNLKAFHKDPDIYDTVYCPLSQCRTMSHVLKLSKTHLGNVEHIDLSHNDLDAIGMLETANMKSLRSLDLRFNNMLQTSALMPLRTLNITELWLDGNPLCENFSKPGQYVEDVRQYCPRLAKLDGIQLGAPGFPLVFKTYVKNWKRRKLVEQFVEHFFSAYDHIDRSVMRGLYADKSWYSTTVGTPTSPTSKKCLEPFGTENRNLLIFGKNSQQLLHYGQEEILKVLRKLPPTQHIKKSFCCDLIYDSQEAIILCVEGLFKLLNAMSQTFSFNRTFVLAPGDDNEYKIVNDQYHVYLPVQGIDNLTYNIDDSESPLKFESTCFSPIERESIIATFQTHTTMNDEYCEKYLRAAGWDMKKALITFLNDYRNTSVDKEAFVIKSINITRY